MNLFSWRFFTIPALAGFSDVSPEELRLEYYDSRANNIIGNYVSILKMLAGGDTLGTGLVTVLQVATLDSFISQL